MEERLVAQAGAEAAPRLTRADAARALGADLARLEDTLAERTQEIQDHHLERTQLTAEQAAAVLSVLTDGNRVSVISAPAGSGKTRGDDRSRTGLGRATPDSCRPSRTAGAMSLLVGALGYVRLAYPVQDRSGQPRYGLIRPAWK